MSLDEQMAENSEEEKSMEEVVAEEATETTSEE